MKVVSSSIPDDMHHLRFHRTDQTCNSPPTDPLPLGAPSFGRLVSAGSLIQALTPLLASAQWSPSCHEAFQPGGGFEPQHVALSDVLSGHVLEPPSSDEKAQQVPDMAQPVELAELTNKPLIPQTVTRSVVNGTEWVSWVVPAMTLKS